MAITIRFIRQNLSNPLNVKDPLREIPTGHRALFQAGVTTTRATPFALRSVRIGGKISPDAWNVTGNRSAIVVGPVAAGWTGNFSGSIVSFTIRGGGFAGTLTFSAYSYWAAVAWIRKLVTLPLNGFGA